MTLKWVAEDDGFNGGQSFGDDQVADDWSLRFRPTSEPDDGLHALITVEYAVCEDQNDTSSCIHCDVDIRRDDNGAGATIWVHEFGSTVCHDDPPGTIEDGDTTTVAEPCARYFFEERTEFMVCTDPDDPGSTERYSDVDYGEGSVLFYSSIESTTGEIKRQLADWIANVNDYISWDGRERVR